MNKRGGFILLTVSMVLAVLAVLTYSLGKMGGLSARTAARSVDAERARLLAEAGLAHALRNMQAPTASAMTGPTACAFNGSFTLGAAGTTTAYLSGGIGGVGTYTVGFFRQADINSEPLPLLLEAVGTLTNGAQHKLRLTLPTLSFALPGGSSAAIASLAKPENDTYVRKDDGGNDNFSTSSTLKLNGPAGDRFQVLLRFDLGDFPGLASNSRVLLVRLGIYQYAGTGANTITAHRISQSWDASSVTWEDRGDGLPDWSTNGGTHDATALGSMAYRTGTGMRWMNLTDTSFVTNTSTGWFSSAGNNGLLLKASSDETLEAWSQNDDSTNLMRAPRLEIVYLKGC